MKWILNRKLAWFCAFLTWVVGDVETTYYGMTRGLKEGNPVMRPFVKRGRWALYPVKAAFFAVMYWAGGNSARSGWSLAVYGASIMANNLGQTIMSHLVTREKAKDSVARVIDRDP